MFVWIGCGTAVTSQAIVGFDADTTNDNSFLTAVALAFGLGISVLVYSVAPISGGHINPAVTFAFVLLGDLSPMVGAFYMMAQCSGAILGAAVLWGMTASNTLMELSDGAPPFLLGVNSVHPDLPVGSAFLGEAVGTFLLVWTVMMTAVSHKSIAGNLAPIAIGWAVLLAHLILVPLTGCGINPARSLGPMLVVIMAGAKVGFDGWWIYYTAPFVGSAAATFICVYVFGVYGDQNPNKPDADTASAAKADDDDGEVARSKPAESSGLTAELDPAAAENFQEEY
jgi:MIP family channel proteins